MPANAQQALNESAKLGITPTEYVYRFCEDLLYQ